MVSLNVVGWTLLARQDFAGAAPLLVEAQPMVAALAAEKPDLAGYARELWLVDVNLGDAKLGLADRDGALASYVDAHEVATGRAGSDPAFAELLKESVDKIGFAANAMLIAGDYEKALAALDRATPAAPSQNWLDLIRAGALMFLDRADDARALYLKHRGEISFGGKTWEALTLEGFKAARAKGREKPLMDEIEKLFAPG